jgi:mono/diheme cytochrome c family protein
MLDKATAAQIPPQENESAQARTEPTLDAEHDAEYKEDAEAPREAAREPGVPIFMWLLYVAIAGWAIYYFATQIRPPQARRQTTIGVTPGATATQAMQASPVATGALPSDEMLLGGSADNGKRLFAQQACSACHPVEAGQPAVIAPNLSNIGNRAATRREGHSAAQYIYESILSPNAYVVTGFNPNIMPGDYGQKLSEEALKDIIAYLLTLKSGQD